MPRSTEPRDKTGPAGPSCETVLDGLEAYLDSLTDPPAAAEGPDPELSERLAAIAAHLERCPACARELTLAARIKAELRSLPRPAPLRPLPWNAGRPSPWWSRRRVAPLAAAAALAAVIGLSVLVRLGRPAPGASPVTPTAAPTSVTVAASPAELSRAETQARYAFARIGEATRRAGLDLRDEVFARRIVAPTAAALDYALDFPTDLSHRRKAHARDGSGLTLLPKRGTPP